jgi:outer membrane protein TolC
MTTHQEAASGVTKDVTNAPSTSNNAGILLDWTLFDGLNMFVSKKMFSTLESLGENGTRIVMEQTVSDVMFAYFGIIQLKKMVLVLQDAVDLSMQRKRIAEAKLSLGAGSNLMLLQSTVDLNADSTALIQQITSLKNTKADFNRILARDPAVSFDIMDSIRLIRILHYDSLLIRSLSQNTEIIAARLDQYLSSLGIRDAQSDRYPTLSLTGGYNYNEFRSQTGYIAYNRSFGPSIGLTLSYNLFDGMNVNRTIRNARISLNSSDVALQDAESSLRTSLLKRYNEYRLNLEIIRMQLSNVKIAKENVDVAFEKYKLGSLNDVELREIQKKLIEAQYELILSRFEAKRAEIDLLRLSGSLLKTSFF